MRKRIGITLTFLMLFLFSALFHAAAENDSLEEKRYLATQQTAYLKVTMEKYHRDYTTTSDKSSMQIDVLEDTEWQLRATYVVCEEGKIVSSKDVTSSCSFYSTDGSKKTLAVSSKGKVKCGICDFYKYTVWVTYYGTVYKMYYNDKHQVVKKEPSSKNYTVGVKFNVKRLEIESKDRDVLRYAAMSELAFDRNNKMAAHENITVAEYVALLKKEGKSSPHILREDMKNSATVNQFLSAAAGSWTILKTDSLTPNASTMHSVAFKSGNKIIIAYGIEFYSLLNDDKKYQVYYEHALDFYDSIVKMGYSDITLTGYYLGGAAAKYVSYLTGKKAYTFGSFTPLSNIIQYGFDKLCKYYSGELQTNYILYEDYRAYKDYYYAIEKTFFMYEQYRNIGLDGAGEYRIPVNYIFQYVKYSEYAEKVSLDYTDQINNMPTDFNYHANRYNFPENDSKWYDFDFDDILFAVKANFGTKRSDAITMEKYAKRMVFGGDGNDDIFLADSTWSALMGNIGRATFSGLVNALMVLPKILDTISDWYELGKKLWDIVGTFTGLDDVNLANHQNIHNVLVGGKGNDRFLGSHYDDTYIYTKGDGHDVIYDYWGLDKIYFLDCKYDIITTKIIAETSEKASYIAIYLNGEEIIQWYGYEPGLFSFGNIKLYEGNPLGNNIKNTTILRNRELAKKAYAEVAGTIACPVDIAVYDKNGKQVQLLQDGKEAFVEADYGIFEVSYDGKEYVKSYQLYDQEHTIKILGNSDGAMDCKFFFNSNTDDADATPQKTQFSDVNVVKDCVFYVPKKPEDGLKVDWDGDGIVDETLYGDAGISFAEKELEIAYGEQKQLTVYYSKASETEEISWSSMDEYVATVDKDGVVTAVGMGKTWVTAETADGMQAMCQITVSGAILSIEDATITDTSGSYEYTGEIIYPNIEVYYKNVLLLENEDYLILPAENIEIGKASITLQGMGKFSGEKIYEYTISEPETASTVEAKVDEIAALCRKNGISDEYEIALWLHDYIIYHADYDFTYTYYYADGVLLNGKGVCQSYAYAYSYLLDKFGIENQILFAPEMDHAWNLVKLDGEWCHVDCTWDDPGNGGAETYTYFGMNDKMMSRDHEWDKTKYPGATAEQNYYYVKKGYAVVRSKDEFISFLEEQASAGNKEIECIYIGEDPEFVAGDLFMDWKYRNDWKYGITEYRLMGSEYHAIVILEYSEPWEQPAEFTGKAPCPDFVLRGPDGTYRLADYKDNGIILIFGREGCLNTRGLLDSLQSHLSELEASGVEVMINVEGASTKEDFGFLEEEYSDFIYTYWDYSLMTSLVKAIGAQDSYNTYPYVFFINKNAMITFSSQGYVADIDAFIKNALDIQTENQLPEPHPADQNYSGSVFCYTGKNNDALKSAIQEQLQCKREYVIVKDSTYTSGEWNYWKICQTIREIAIQLRKNTCDYTVDSQYVYVNEYDHTLGIIVEYDTHTIVEDAFVEATCTEAGVTEGSHCSVCGKVFVEQQPLSALGHDMEYVDRIDATCSEDGTEAYYHCKDCGKDFLDEYGEENIEKPVTIPGGHKFTDWISNNNGTHITRCERDPNHYKEEKCSYTYTVIQKKTDSQPEKGKYTCQKCGYSFEVERKEVDQGVIRISQNHFHYDGKEKKPKVQIDGLAEKVDYLLEYENNIKPGTGIVRIKGIGNYSGTIEVPFTIEDHIAVKDPEVKATCSKAGKTAGSHCSVCGVVLTAQKNTPKIKHTYGNYKITKNATALANGTKTRQCKVCGSKDTVAIKKLAATIRVTTSVMPIQLKKSVNLGNLVTGLAKGDYIKRWSSSNPSVARVSSSGKVTANKVGTSKVIVTLASGKTGSITIKVQKNAVSASSIKNIPGNLTIKKGTTSTLKPVIEPLSAQNNLTFTSSNKTVATVSSKGVITAKKSGTAKITVKSGSKKVVVVVKVTAPAPTSISNIPAKLKLKMKKTYILKPKIFPTASEAKITYTSSNTKVATVSANGKITAKKAGAAWITVKAGKITVKCKLQVK